MRGQQNGGVGPWRQIRREIVQIAQDAIERIDPEVDAPFFRWACTWIIMPGARMSAALCKRRCPFFGASARQRNL